MDSNLRSLSFCPRCVTIFIAFPCTAPGGTIPEEHHFMSRSTLMALAIACVLTCTSYAQDSAPKPQQSAPAASSTTQTPPAAQTPAPPAAQTPAPPAAQTPAPPAANTLPSTSVVPLTEPVLTLKGACQPKAGSTEAGCVSSL